MTAIVLFLALAQEPPTYDQAVSAFKKFSGSDDPAERAEAARLLGESAVEKKDEKTAEMLISLLTNELARGAHGKGDWSSSGWVIMNVIDSIAGCDADADRLWRARPGIRDAKAIEWLVDDVLKKKSRPWRVKFYAAIACGRLPGDNVAAALGEIAQDKDPRLQIAAFEAMARRKDKTTTQDLVKAFKAADSWEGKSAALHAMRQINDEACVDGLIEFLFDVEKRVRDGGDTDLVGRLLDDTVFTLRQVTGLDGGFIPGLWEQMWQAKKKGTKPPTLDENKTMVRPTEFYGIQSHSSRVIFMIDCSGSMGAKASDKEKNVVATGGVKLEEVVPGGPVDKLSAKEQGFYKKCKEALDKAKKMSVTVRIEGVKKELTRCLYYLEPYVCFNVVAYDSGVRTWKDELVPATWENKFGAMQYMQGQEAMGGTNYFDTLRTGFEFVDKSAKGARLVQDKKLNYAEAINGADTFYLLSDGEPTYGALLDKDQVSGELRKTNLLRRTIVHAICIGDFDAATPELRVDPKFLKRLAEENGGQFKHVTKK